MPDKKIQSQFGEALATALTQMLADKSVRESFGERLIEIVASFARQDLDDPPELENGLFRFVADKELRGHLAKTFYGTRWLYKLGLALVARDDELAAHVRAQVVDYGSVAEGVLSYGVGLAIRKSLTKQQRYKFSDFKYLRHAINWNVRNPDPVLAEQSFAWLIEIGSDFGLVDAPLKTELHWLRDQRNTVHLRKLVSIGQQGFLSRSMRAFETALRTSQRVGKWCAAA